MFCATWLDWCGFSEFEANDGGAKHKNFWLAMKPSLRASLLVTVLA